MHRDTPNSPHLLWETSKSASASKHGMWDAGAGRNLMSCLLWAPCAEGVERLWEDYRDISEGKAISTSPRCFPFSPSGLS